MRFDYLHDPRSPQLERFLSSFSSAETRRALMGLGFTCLVMISSCGIENHRVNEAKNHEIAIEAQYMADRTRIQRLELNSAQTIDLLDLAHKLQEIRLSGYRHARMLATLGTQLPASAWLTSLTPQLNDTQVTGRTFNLAAVGDVLEHLNSPQLGQAKLDHIARIEAPLANPQLEFTITLHKE